MGTLKGKIQAIADSNMSPELSPRLQRFLKIMPCLSKKNGVFGPKIVAVGQAAGKLPGPSGAT